MESHQDFRSLQAKFQVSQPQPGELPRKPPKPEFNKLLKKFPQSELSEKPSKSLQPEFSAVLLNRPQPEFTNFPKKPPQPKFSNLPKKPPKPEVTDLPRKPPQPEFTNLPKKLPKPEFGEHLKKSPQPEAPQKALQPQPELSNPARPSSILKLCASPKFWQIESSEVTQTPSSKSESGEPYPHSPKADLSTLFMKSPQSELNENVRKSPQPCPKSPQQPEFYELPQTPPWKPGSCDPPPHSPQLGFSAKKHPQLQLSGLTRTSSEPEVCPIPKKQQQPEFKVFLEKPEPVHLPRTSSEPEFSLLPRKFVQLERQGQTRKFSQPELKNPLQPEFKGLPRKPQLPGSVSESSLPTAIASSSPRFGAAGTPRWRSDDFQARHPPKRRPLPSVTSLGSPPAKPPLPPGPINIQSYWRASARTQAVQRTHSSAGIHFQARRPQHTLWDSDKIDELYDAVEPTEGPSSSPSPRGRDEVQSTQQATRRPQQDSELRKEKGTQAQQLPPMDPKLLKQIRKAEKTEREFRKKFKFEGEIVIHTKMMIDPNAKTRRGGGKHLGIRRGEILEVIEFTSKDEMLCRDPKGKYGYVPRTALLPLETEVYDDVGFWDPLDSQPSPQGL